jgi:hypothetical protein
MIPLHLSIIDEFIEILCSKKFEDDKRFTPSYGIFMIGLPVDLGLSVFYSLLGEKRLTTGLSSFSTTI